MDMSTKNKIRQKQSAKNNPPKTIRQNQSTKNNPPDKKSTRKKHPPGHFTSPSPLAGRPLAPQKSPPPNFGSWSWRPGTRRRRRGPAAAPRQKHRARREKEGKTRHPGGVPGAWGTPLFAFRWPVAPSFPFVLSLGILAFLWCLVLLVSFWFAFGSLESKPERGRNPKRHAHVRQLTDLLLTSNHSEPRDFDKERWLKNWAINISRHGFVSNCGNCGYTE